MIRDVELAILKTYLSEVAVLSDDCWRAFSRMLSYKNLVKGEYFSEELSKTKELGFIISGLVRIFSIDEEGIEWNKSLLPKHEFIMASINPTIPSPVSIQAIFDTRLLTIQYNDFMKLSLVYPEMSNLIQKLATRYLEREKSRNNLLMIKKSADRLEHFKNEFPDIYHEIPREHIASYIGVAQSELSF